MYCTFHNVVMYTVITRNAGVIDAVFAHILSM